jgi:dipeptidyl aminopeptidase/acylaminoacyl peptidase
MPRTRRAALLAAVLAVLPAPALVAQQAPAADMFTVEKYLDYETVGDPQVSPDGSQVVYTRRWVNKQEDRWDAALWVMNADGSRNRFLTRGSNATWSPDGTRIAYLADGEPKGMQVWVRWMDRGGEGAATQVTRAAHSPANLGWSPDGRTLGFTMFVPKPASWSISMPSAPEGAKWTATPRLVERLHFRQDRQGFTEPGYVHLFTVPADGGTPRQLTQGEWNVGYRFDGLAGGVGWSWTPDGRTIVVEGLQEPDSDLRYRDSNLYAVDVASASIRRLTPDRGTWRQPVVSPNGRWIVYTGAPFMPQTYRAEGLYLMAVDGSGGRKLSGSMDRDPGELRWAPDGSGVYFTADDRGSRNLHFASVDGAVRAVTSGVRYLSLGSVSKGGVALGVVTTPREPGDVARIDLRRGEVAKLTSVNDDLLGRMRLGEVEEVWYTSSGGARVQGWIVKPPSFDASRKYPLIMEIHGGPHAMYNVAFNPMFQNFAAHGYVVLYTNPRGSTGYGTEFGNAIDRAYPSVDYDDLMAGVDEVVRRGYVDASKMYVGGCSGGGVLSSWVIGHTDRFAAAAVRCPVINWMSFMGQTDIPLFVGNFFERPFWEDPQPWLKQSPLMYVGNVKTPTLLMTGDLDLRTPMPQTEEYFAALKTRGVPTALLRFAGEYHGTSSKPSNWMRTQLYMMSWYERHGARRAAPAQTTTTTSSSSTASPTATTTGGR